MAEFVTVDGLSDLTASLKQMGTRIMLNGAQASVYAGAVVIKKQAKANARDLVSISLPGDDEGTKKKKKYERTGTLERAIYISRNKVRPSDTNYRKTMIVGVRKGSERRTKNKKGENTSTDAWYAGWVEFGTKPSLGRASRMRKNGQRTYGTRATNRTVVARPFLRTALESKKAEALDAIKNRLAKAVDDARLKGLGK